MTINHCYWEYNCKCHCARQAEKEALESYSQKQEKASISDFAMASQIPKATVLQQLLILWQLLLRNFQKNRE